MINILISTLIIITSVVMLMLVKVIKRKVKVLWSHGEDLDDNDGECHKKESESSLVTWWRAHAMYCPPNASCPECPFVLIICLFLSSSSSVS